MFENGEIDIDLLFQTKRISHVVRQTRYISLGGGNNKLRLIKRTLILRRQEN